MDKSSSSTRGYLIAAALGAVAGGTAVALLTRAVPVMMARMMSNMMENMMAQMGGEGCDPEEM